ncbi:MAG: EFR1 family ferrodoxin [Methanobacteriaceae archaeon]|nr:EFR1 family ferrodoxin [Methanobacteriaceae archaeon]
MKILYFTSTGNSLYVAKKIGGTLLSIPQLIKENVYTIEDDVIGIIFPVYGCDMPLFIENYLKKVELKSNYTFIIVTYGNSSLYAPILAEELLNNKNIKVHYIEEVLMVDNYLPLFEMEMEKEKKSNEKIDLIIEKIKKDIHNKKEYKISKNIIKKPLSKLVSIYFRHSFSNNNKKFMINNQCNNCQRCIKVCPVGNISLTENKIEYMHKCISCLACIHLCPTNAIHLSNEKSKNRFLNKHVKITEIIKSNNQL